ncbi:MAG: MATE family efflux transporter [Oscillospiraceae bacterium]|nr:MATE family efflux transporter [Oscillospiraceae bacterium]
MRIITRDREYYKSIFMLAVPVALQSLITFTVNFADNVMVSTLGDYAVSGVYLGNQIQTLLQMFSGGIEGAILILGAQYWGRKNMQGIKRIVAVGLQMSLLFGVFLTVFCSIAPKFIIGLFTEDATSIANGVTYLRIVCFSYVFFCMTQSLIACMRSIGNAKIGTVVSLISLFINVGLNYSLINGKFGFPKLGIRGAAVATLIARMAESAIIAVFVFVKDKDLRLTVKDCFYIDKEIRKDFIRYGLPIVGGNMVWSVNLLCNSAILGRFGASVVTAASIVNSLNTFAYIGLSGLCTGISVLTGKTIGQHRLDKVKEYSYTSQVLMLLVGMCIGTILFVIKGVFVGFYRGVTQEAAAYALQFSAVLSVTIIGTAYQMTCLAGLVKAGGDTSFVFKNDMIFVFLVVLPSAFISAKLGAAPWIVFMFLKCDQVLKCFVAYFKINSFNWVKDLTRDTA